MSEIMQGLFNWAWSLYEGAVSLAGWLFTPISILSWEVAPIYLVGAGLITAGVIRGIIGVL